jgi:CrtC N-terminal lipocalin domain
MSVKHPVLARLGSTPEEYEQLGISSDLIEPREDGMRTDGGKGTFEWWYFDAALSDGSTLVVTFNTKLVTDADHPLAPYANVCFDRPDGTKLDTNTPVFTEDFKASTEGCDVRMGPNTFVGDLNTYDIHVETDEITVDVTLTGEVPAWRPKTGHFLFEEDEHLFFAWLPSVPQGKVTATITVGGETVEVTGTGYHDHNWGNCSMLKVIDNWYWGRAQLGPYTVIACLVTGAERYGFAAFPIFLLAKDGQVVADDDAMVTFVEGDVHIDEVTGKPVGNVLTYTYAGEVGFRVTWERKETIFRAQFIDALHGLQHFVARLIGFDGAYLRFTGNITLEKLEGGQVEETETNEAIWEEMYFGRNHKD